jgi:hypothetical protein
MYEQKSSEKQASKAEWRKKAPKADVLKATKAGFTLCQPYQALPCPELDEIRKTREPSAAARSKFDALSYMC